MDICPRCKNETYRTEVSPVWFEEFGYGDIPDSEYLCPDCFRKEEIELSQMQQNGEIDK